MKNLPVILLSVLGGIVGAYLFSLTPELYVGATVARTTITNPWTFATGTTMTKSLTVTTTNAATSSISAGCYQLVATSTSNPIKLVVTSVATTAPTFAGSVTGLAVMVAYGTCP